MSDEEKTKKRSIINWTDEQHERLTVAASRLGMSVPQYCKVSALTAEREQSK